MKKLLLIITLVTSFSYTNAQHKNIVNDYASLKKELIAIKTEAEEYASDIKTNWKNDTMKLRARMQYVKLSAAVDGVVDGFKTTILRPKSITPQVRTSIEADVTRLKAMLGDFTQIYVDGTLAKGGEAPTETSLMAAFTVGMGLFNDFKKMVSSQRDEMAKQFEADTKLKKWDQI
jgi:hypothetical protein